ncbi:VOC family protein [Neorhizobium galegae]|uniref:Glyoxalase/bleomycin resistance protein/dioxygenase superfamily n=1 Tax=Neorhizobium galegae bv. orientalis str. HAMBI 540 TaxID=1028800 RepID=A0A068SRF1_NEOGA|nr:glyoxalase/bleomycin resistance/extradiol dioxygenase family protein [Neorhizobium galegae]MCQ1850998.1 glyoxalase/bleomycin resistance/extradiol dioxygenase family protein [Neorhizobium galegae]CDN48803.1 Glyoxalase/bleomycin resistance protein/dioxygenase superfamily [Neorhizobium galegae bv. orientalis str. HAMBI 540]CDZ52341.1 Conserved hypothethical protein (Putative Glyoxalase/Bleomycin resistance protein/Dihydroxybiphenyl dioxygenase) [Neorhizobium galegae bv. orientalis]
MDTSAQTNDKQVASPVRGGVVAYLQLDGAMKAAEYYKNALGAEIESFHPVDDQGRTMHIHLYINGSSVMLCDPYPDYGHPLEKPQAFTMMLPVDDIDFWWKRAVDAGMTVETELQVMFWGDRYGQVRDPFGVAWAMNAPVKG